MINKRKTSVYGVWRGERNTPIVIRAKTAAEAIRKSKEPVSAGGKPHKAVGWDKSVKGVKKLSGQDLKEAISGKWVRTRVSGKRVTGKAPEKTPPKYRPGLYKKRKK